MSPPRASAFARAASWPIDHPRMVLAAAFVLALLASIAVSQLRRSNSLHDLLGGQSDSAAALQRVMDRFAVVDELLVLATDSDRAARPTPEESSAFLLRFAAEFEAAVVASPEASAMCSRIRSRPDTEVLEFFREEVVPAGLLYLDDLEFERIAQRLTPSAMAEQIRQNEAMIGAPGPAAGALAKQMLRDPLRLR